MNRPFLPVLAGFLGLSAAASAAQERPNIVLIVTDDGGWADFGFNGCKDYATPNMDRIAKEGVNFTAGYVSASVCSPSRAGLMTGRYNERYGHEYNIVAQMRDGLPLSETLFPARLKALGYTTAAIGKWHLGGAKGFQPFERGFDYSYGFIGGSRGYYPDTKPTDNAKTWRRNGTPVVEKEYVTDAVGRETVGFIRKAAEAKKPFFVYSAFTCPHEPMQAKPGYEAKFARIKDSQRRTLAAMMLSEDEAVGAILDTLKEKGLENDTLVWLINDNGAGTYWRFDNGVWRGKKGSLFEGGVRVAFAARWPGHIPAGLTYAKPVISLDIAATSVAAAGAPVPTSLDGVNLVPHLAANAATSPHETLYWRQLPAATIRDGDWKLITVDAKPVHLFNLAKDPSEKNDLLAREPEKAKSLAAKLSAWEALGVPPAWRKDEEKLTRKIREIHTSEKDLPAEDE